MRLGGEKNQEGGEEGGGDLSFFCLMYVQSFCVSVVRIRSFV